jgi:hypothetical protein
MSGGLRSKITSCERLVARSQGVHSLLYFAYTCVRDLFIVGVIYLAEKSIRWWYFTCKKPENIICDGILHWNMFHYFKIPYFKCFFFYKIYLQWIYWTLFFIARCSTIFASELPESQIHRSPQLQVNHECFPSFSAFWETGRMRKITRASCLSPSLVHLCSTIDCTEFLSFLLGIIHPGSQA